MKLLSICLFLLLSAIAALHAYWGLGGLWPGTTVQELIDTVVGDPRLSVMPPPLMTLIVAGLIFCAGCIALAMTRLLAIGPVWLARIGVIVLAAIFILRGLLGFFLNWRGIEQTEPFATYDYLYYSPLCILIGAGFLILAFHRTSTSSQKRPL